MLIGKERKVFNFFIHVAPMLVNKSIIIKVECSRTLNYRYRTCRQVFKKQRKRQNQPQEVEKQKEREKKKKKGEQKGEKTASRGSKMFERKREEEE